jgi:hypothetical protein
MMNRESTGERREFGIEIRLSPFCCPVQRVRPSPLDDSSSLVTQGTNPAKGGT